MFAVAWEGSDRRSRLPSDWATRRLRVLRRDSYRCRWVDEGRLCGAPASDVDHIERGDNHELSNLQALCRWHHARKSAAEGNAARGPRVSRLRAGEAHPGAL